MNKLEEQIEASADKFYSVKRIDGDGDVSNYELGAQFVIDLKLPVKFAEWVSENASYFPDGNYYMISEAVKYNTMQLYQFWIENIYGR